MTLVTKCPHCQTTFKVTEDQLNLYEGAVRCGICQQVFNGTEYLKHPEVLASKNEKEVIGNTPLQEEPKLEKKPSFYTDEEEDDLSLSLADEDINALPDREALFQALEDELAIISLELEQVSGDLFEDDLIVSEEKEEQNRNEYTSKTQPLSELSLPQKNSITSHSGLKHLSSYPNLGEQAKNKVFSTAPHLEEIDNNPLSNSTEIEEPDNAQKESLQKSQFSSASYYEIDNEINKIPHSPIDEAKKSDTTTNTKVKELNFIKTEKKTKNHFFSNMLLGLVTIALLGAFSIQCLYMFSDRMIVWWPPSEEIISKACHIFVCPRRLETRISALTIESSELQIIPELKNKYALSLLIRNSSSSYQSWPHIELTLTDQEKKTIIRKIFAPSNYLPNAESIMKGISPYAEKSVGLYLEMKTEPNVDYRISLFHP